jgi:hypothetical protein
MRSSLYEVRIERLVDVGRVDMVPGFFAITRSPQLREMLARVLDLGAVVTAAVHRSLLIGYAADLPFLPIKLEHGEWKRRWQTLSDRHESDARQPWRCACLARVMENTNWSTIRQSTQREAATLVRQEPAAIEDSMDTRSRT